jgi:hypothetical protein
MAARGKTRERESTMNRSGVQFYRCHHNLNSLSRLSFPNNHQRPAPTGDTVCVRKILNQPVASLISSNMVGRLISNNSDNAVVVSKDSDCQRKTRLPKNQREFKRSLNLNLEIYYSLYCHTEVSLFLVAIRNHSFDPVNIRAEAPHLHLLALACFNR